MLAGTVLMNISKSLNLAVLSLFCIGLPLAGHGQTYYLSTPLTSGYYGNAPSLPIQDADYSTNIIFTWNTLTETIYVDPVAQTIRQVGFASVVPSVSSFFFNKPRQTPEKFPNPKTNVKATVSV